MKKSNVDIKMSFFARPTQEAPEIPPASFQKAQTLSADLLSDTWSLRSQLTKKTIWRRFGIAIAVVILLHLVFALVIAPSLEFASKAMNQTEVVQITPQQLAALKKKIQSQQKSTKDRLALLRQEQREDLKTAETPDNAKMIGAFNQKVEKERIARPQAAEPLEGGGAGGKGSTAKSRGKNQPQTRPEPKQKLELSKLGLGRKLRPPQPQAPSQPESLPAGRPGPQGPYRPRGFEDKSLDQGDENLLNAVESKYYSFFLRLEEPIIRNWFFNLRREDALIHSEMAMRQVRAGSELPITIEFILDRQGNFRSIDVIESSGIPSLDRVTQEAVKKLGALPNPPPDLFDGGPYFTKRLRFMVHVTDAPVLNERPDLAW